MATLALAPIRVHSLNGLTSIPQRHAPEDASETYKVGALLVINASTGQIAECGADPALVQGVALHDAKAVQGQDVHYVVPRRGVVFEVSMDESGAQGVYALVQTDLGKRYGAAKDATTGYWYLDQDETTADVFEIVGFVSAIGDIRPRVLAEFVEAALSEA
jgi:hypothetical protein